MPTTVSDLDWLEARSAQLLRPCESALPFVGAGLSLGAGLPGGPRLAEWLARLDLADGADFGRLSPSERGHCVWVADEIAQRDPAVEAELRRRICSRLAMSQFPHAQPTPAQRALVRVPSKLCLTLNYDLLLENAADLEGVLHESVVVSDLGSHLDRMRNRDHPLFIVHLHGAVSDEDSIVITSGDYQRVSGDPQVEDLFALALYMHNVCLLGMSFDEAYIAQMFARRTQRYPRHVFVGDRSTIDAIKDGRGAIRESAHGITLSAFPDGEWSALDAFAEWLVRCDPVPPEAPPLTRERETPVDENYVPVRLVPRDDEASTDQLSLHLALDLVEAVADAEVAREDRCVIQGQPGSGKTSLLHHLGGLTPEGEIPIYVPLHLVDASPGAPAAVLSAWAAHGEALRERASVTTEMLGAKRFHFLLDGLDEVSPDRREAVAKALIEITEALPQHRYVVAARPVPALDEFPQDGWRHLVLSPDERWRDDFLDERGLSMNVLLDEVEGLGALVGLMSVPFFLRKVVELRDEGRLRQVRDLQSLALTLIDARLVSDDKLTVAAETVRDWLRAVAYGLQLCGRTSATIDELRGFDVDVPDAIGDLGQLTELLVTRALLRDEDGRFAFQHRLMQEALAAEVLAEAGPTESLLQAVAPAVTDSVTGVRAEWAVPLQMVMSREPEWRDAIKARDALSAARAVPIQADEEERRWAARTIWDYYLSVRLWIHDWHRPRPREDGEVLAGFLSDPALNDVLDDVIAGLETDQRQVRSNAIEVLGMTEWTGLVRATRRILTRDHDLVVRRQAASVARSRNLRSLYEPIKRRAMDPADQSEAQDMASVAMHLAPDSEVLALASDLASNAERLWAVESKVRKRLSPSDQVRYLRMLTERGGDTLSSTKQELVSVLDRISRASAKTAEDVGWVAACWGLTEELVISWMLRRPSSVLGVIDAVDAGRAYPYEVMPLLEPFSDRVLQRHGASDEILEYLQVTEPRALRAAEPQPYGPLVSPDRDEVQRPATLADLLRRPRAESDDLLQANAQTLAAQVRSLAVEDRRRLRYRLGLWWRPDEFETAVTLDGSRYTLANWAAAWLFYGPKLDASLTTDQWVLIATCRFMFTEQQEWLRRRFTRACGVAVINRCRDTRIGTWADIVDSIPPGRLSDAASSAIADRGSDLDDPSRLRALAGRLAAEGKVAALRRIADRGPEFAAQVTPRLAEVGDSQALAAAVTDLRATLESGESPETGSLTWAAAVTEERLLADLMACLALAYPRDTPLAFPDLVNPIQHAIRRIGGERAVSAYDALLAEEPFDGVHFLRLERDAIVQDILAEQGVRAAREMASSEDVHLPC